MFEAVIFDWDGTLADTKKVILLSFHKALKEVDCDVSSEFIANQIGVGAAETFREILRKANRPFDEKLVERLVARKSQLQIENIGQVHLFEGAVELLEALQGKVKVGLASMNNRIVILQLVKELKVEKFFPIILTAESISQSKPDPEIFLKCAQQLKAKPSKCVVFEDSVFGVKAAKSAGMACIAVTTGVYKKADLQKECADLVVSTLKSKQIAPFIFT
jgi:HAD superfamily hydrolase (TIGR01509 family)